MEDDLFVAMHETAKNTSVVQPVIKTFGSVYWNNMKWFMDYLIDGIITQNIDNFYKMN